MLETIAASIGVTVGCIIMLKVVQYEMKQAKIERSHKIFF